MTYKTTLNEIRKHSPCQESWQKLLKSLGKTRADNTEVGIDYILDLLGLDDALWALRALPPNHDNAVRMLVCDLVEPSLQYVNDPRPAEAIRVARLYAVGKASKNDLYAAKDAAWAAAGAAAEAAAWAAAGAAAGAAAEAAAWAAAEAAAEAAAWAAAGAAAEAAAWAAAEAAARVEVRAKQEGLFRRWMGAVGVRYERA